MSVYDPKRNSLTLIKFKVVAHHFPVQLS